MSGIANMFGIGASVRGFGDIMQGNDQATAMRTNAQIYGGEASTASTQGFQAEATQRRAGAMAIGRETAAAGQAGGGYGGSTGRAIGQSIQNAELDALNVRYKSQMQRWSYGTQAAFMNQEAKTQGQNGLLKAGASLLQGYSSQYTGPAQIPVS
jgi:hypothetical protein